MPPEKIESAHFSTDTREFIALLQAHAVRYVIVGGEAVIFHGYARLTGDVDFFYERSEANARALFAALTNFWAGDVPGIAAWNELLEEGVVFQFGRPPNRIDLLNAIDGVQFHEAWATRQTVEMQGAAGVSEILVYFVSLASLLKNKAAAGRPKDLEDLRYLRRSAEQSQR